MSNPRQRWISGDTGTGARRLAVSQARAQGPVQRSPAVPREEDTGSGGGGGDLMARAASPADDAPVALSPQLVPHQHEWATVVGLGVHFGPDELGAVYAASWERAFARGSTKIANAAIGWRRLELYARDRGDVLPVAAAFRRAVREVIWMNLTELRDESFGGSAYWEHAERPVEAGQEGDADARWRGRSDGLAGYLADARAYIKDQMVAAVDVYRMARGCEPLGRALGGEIWRCAPPRGYVRPDVRLTRLPDGGPAIASELPAEHDDAAVASRGPIRDHAYRLTVRQGRPETAPAALDPDLWHHVGAHLGRAVHALEDFWAQSTWIELGLELQAARHRTEDVLTSTSARPLDPSRLVAGAFTFPSRCQVLGQQVLAMTTALLVDFERLRRVYGRAGGAGLGDAEVRAAVLAPLDNVASAPMGDLVDLANAIQAVALAIQAGHVQIDDFLCDREILAALARKARILVGEPPPERRGVGVLQLAIAANEQVIAPLRAIMDQDDDDLAKVALRRQLDRVDRMMAVPSIGHPLWRLLEVVSAGRA